MAKHTLKIFQSGHRKIFKVYLAIFQYHVWNDFGLGLGGLRKYKEKNPTE